MGTVRSDLMASELGIKNVGQLVSYFPFRYVDRSKVYPIRTLNATGEYVQIKGVLGPLKEEGTGRKTRLRAQFKDESGSIEFIWFKGIKWLKENLIAGNTYIAFGKVSVYQGQLNIAHPELEKVQGTANPVGYLQPIYSTTEMLLKRGVSSKAIERATKDAVFRPEFQVDENLPLHIREELKLISRKHAYQAIHHPKSSDELLHAKRRIKFEELFYIQLELLLKKELRYEKIKGHSFTQIGEYFNNFYKNYLPFELTGAQKRVLKEIRRDMQSGHQMNRLLQGDVGSGKTMVSALVALIAIDNGFQAAIMAPTEILAIQHAETFKEQMEPLGIKVALLTGSTKKAARTIIHEGILSGEIQILIGTHALLESVVAFKNLGVAIVDEQHRFGVAQRARLWSKNVIPPHILVMTATPIPRTLAMTLYGDLEVSVIDELPPGRKPIETLRMSDKDRLRIFGFMEDQIKRGRQIYVVYPLIEESSTLDLKDLMDGYESLARRFPTPDFQISVVHGRMKSADKDFEMNRFVEGKTQIMVATTVIEVGVNVPNASVMVIESAQRFGLSQLHQLRGRVGRGAEKSYCLLVADAKLSNEGRTRLQTMCDTNDGFKIAEVDLQLRGPGNLMGTQQSGDLQLKLADLATDSKILLFARNTALDILDEDPQLQMEKHILVRQYAEKTIMKKPNWSLIS